MRTNPFSRDIEGIALFEQKIYNKEVITEVQPVYSRKSERTAEENCWTSPKSGMTV